ncbi:glycosyltransferase family 2 protein [Candidatus Pacearchaeota archaeon]|nr:glycosyltransferase family 2 protein [Candidatus Pacearchaeota archaeon]
MEPEISVVVPTYNVEKYISQTLQSVKDQTINPSRYEVIIFDDGSTDNTNSIVQTTVKGVRNIKHYKRIENKGSAITRNDAIDQAQGKLISLLDADDLLEPQAIESTLKFMNKNPGVKYSYSKHRRVYEKSGFIEDRPCQEYSFEDLFHYNFVGPIKCFTRELHEEIGGFDPELLDGEDWNHALQAALILKDGQFKQNPEFLYNYKIRANSITTSKGSERKKIIEKFLTERLAEKGIFGEVYRSHKTDEGYNYYDWRIKNEGAK